MNNLQKTILSELEKLNEEIRQALDSKNISNTGEAANSLRTEVIDNIGRSYGVFYLEFLDTGRGPGKFPDINKIRLWVRQKLNITDERRVEQVTFLVSRKIAAIGTQIFNNNNKGIELDEKIKKTKLSLNERISKAAKSEVVQMLDKFKKKYKFQI